MAESLKIAKSAASEKSRFLGRTYGWMAFALLISGIVAYFVSGKIYASPIGTENNSLTAFGSFLFANGQIGFWILAIAELVTVFVLSARIRKMSVMGAVLGFMLYSVLNGITLSSIFIVYEAYSIISAFLGTSVMFGVMSLWGLTTKRNLATFGRYLIMGLFGIIITNLIGFVISKISGVQLVMLDYILMIASAIVFTGLAAYDSQKVALTAEHARNNDDYKKVSIIAALELYLDFINLFLIILRFVGKNRD